MLMEEYLDNVLVVMLYGLIFVFWFEFLIKVIFFFILIVEEDGFECCRIENLCLNFVSEDEVLLNLVVFILI